MKKFLLIIALIISGMGLNAQNLGEATTIYYEGYSLQFTITNVEPAECSVRCSTQPTEPTAITIPETVEINGVEFNVTSIRYEAFYECSSLISIDIPSGVTTISNNAFFVCSNLEKVVFGENSQLATIGEAAFYYCSSLTSIEIPSGVTTIAENAFCACSSLTSIEIPSGVTEIGNFAFLSCQNLESVTFGENSQLATIGEAAFAGCSSLTSIEIPSGVTTIGEAAFNDCSSLTSIEIPSSVTTIGNSAFYYCSSLTSIEIPSGVTTIGEGAFRECSSLTSIEIPSSVTEIGSGAFSVCVRLESVTFGEDSQLATIGTFAFESCSILTRIEIPGSVTSIGEYAFAQCSNLNYIRCYAENVPGPVMGVWDDFNGNMFSGADNIKNIQVPESSIEAYKTTQPWMWHNITKIYPYFVGEEFVIDYEEGYSLKFTAMEDFECSVTGSIQPTEPTAITIPATVEINGVEVNVTSIGNEAFNSCSSLTSIEIPSSVTTIEGFAFYNCSSLTSIEIPSSVTTIGNNTFNGCSNLEKVVFEEDSELATIEESAFRNCSSLTSIEIPSSVTTIGNAAFFVCSNLEKVVFEENSQLTTIGELAFVGCSSLTSIEIPNSVTTIGGFVFEDCSNLVKVAFEENSQLQSIENSAFRICGNLRSIEIPNSVKSIEKCAFEACYALTNVSFEENSQLVSIGKSAFNANMNLKSIEIPSSVKEIQDEAFGQCWGLEEVTFEENSQLTSLGKSVFAGAPIKEIELPSCLTAIGSSAFKDCAQLKSVFIPKNVEYIRILAFQNCSQLETVIIEEGSKLTSINDLSFSGCNNLQKIVIPSGVTYIGFESFANCNNMTMVECYATDVPQTDSDAFNGCPERMRIQVPAESLEKYQAETPWNNYTLVTEIVRHEIVTSINKEYMGTTEGDGTYFNGESVTVKATAREYGSSWRDENGQWHSFYDNSTFVYWTENGEFVSREQEYTFVAEADRNLQANFMNNNHWTADPGISSHNMTVWADVQLEGVSANNINIEIGAFCDGELRGNARIQYFEAVDKFMYQLVIYGTNNDNIKFKLYDHNTQKEMEYLSHDYLTFVEDATHGSVETPKVINFIPISRIPIEVVCNIPEACDVEGAGDYFQGEQVTITANDVEGFLFKNWTLDGNVISTDKSYTFRVERQLRFTANYEYAHIRHLNKGWNWYSTYMQLSGAEGLETVQSALGSAATQIKSQTAFDTYEYGEWIGALDEYYTEKMYMIDINSYYGQDITIKGTPANPSDYTIELKPNWNWVGYPVSYNMSIDEALQNITPMHGDYFKSQTHFSQYYEGAGWLGALQTLEKGQGYMYQNISGETREFVYPNQSNAKSELKSNASLANNYWNANMSAYPTNMSVIAIVENNGMEMSDYEIAAFSNGECRGSARPIYIEQLDVYMTFLTICGEVGETLTFKYYDVASAETYTLSSVITYAANATLGTIDTPYIMSMSTTGINENTYDKVNVYPNPVNVNSELYLETECDNVEIYNALGVRIAEYENVSKIDGIETSGVYVIKVTEQGNVKYNRIVVK